MTSLPSTGSDDQSAVPEALRGMIVQAAPEDEAESISSLAGCFAAFDRKPSSDVLDAESDSLRPPATPLALFRQPPTAPGVNAHFPSDSSPSAPAPQHLESRERTQSIARVSDHRVEPVPLKAVCPGGSDRRDCLAESNDGSAGAVATPRGSLSPRAKTASIAGSSSVPEEGSLAGSSEPGLASAGTHQAHPEQAGGARHGSRTLRQFSFSNPSGPPRPLFPRSGSRSAFRPHIPTKGETDSRAASGPPRTEASAFSGDDEARQDRTDCALQIAREYGLDLTAEGWNKQDSLGASAAKPPRPWERLDPRHSVVSLAKNVTGYGFYFGATDSPYPMGHDEESHREDTPAGQRQIPAQPRTPHEDADAPEAGSGFSHYGRCFRFQRMYPRNAGSKQPTEASAASRSSQSIEKQPTFCGCLRYATAWRRSRGRHGGQASGPLSRKEMRPRKLKHLKCENVPPFLGPQREEHKSRTTLVLDLDETLVHSSFRPVSVAAFVITVEVEGKPHKIHVCKRPGVDRFLEVVSSLYEVVIFTASLQTYADPLIDLLDPKGLCPYRLFRSSCSHWFFNMADRELDDLTSILAVMATVQDVPAVLKETVGPSCRERVLQELRLLGEVEDKRDEEEWFNFCQI
ncbi:hypothetical protein NCLIV_054710 [Neospora caninum Liverpool]|uniref:FCP1 homology domain-containing protein n=1 Tax=Neospora caninum (strain Liverpool) TaxID=572307 RepID=F0VMV0_NEOCL|nr:hypothetical protein NCLIV_054710 [Neospora caninum Liverpool]CBZ55046.1 hypothetical protein NCLIV_054710 [Neospora caninum Liverpool]|eukprot:XP_003885074.1 hypothetical protein NCLIV_054710 [Neospora caninum Liverpool]